VQGGGTAVGLRWAAFQKAAALVSERKNGRKKERIPLTGKKNPSGTKGAFVRNPLTPGENGKRGTDRAKKEQVGRRNQFGKGEGGGACKGQHTFLPKSHKNAGAGRNKKKGKRGAGGNR